MMRMCPQYVHAFLLFSDTFSFLLEGIVNKNVVVTHRKSIFSRLLRGKTREFLTPSPSLRHEGIVVKTHWFLGKSMFYYIINVCVITHLLLWTCEDLLHLSSCVCTVTSLIFSSFTPPHVIQFHLLISPKFSSHVFFNSTSALTAPVILYLPLQCVGVAYKRNMII